MKKRIFLIYGWDGYPEENWFPWLKRELEARSFSAQDGPASGWEVFVPKLSDSSNPRINIWIPEIAKAVGTPDENTFFVGHSMGCQAICRFLESLPEGMRIGGAVFVAGFFKRLTGIEDIEDQKATEKHWLSAPIDFTKVKSRLQKSIAIFSDNDPFVPLDNQGDFRDKLGSKIIVEHQAGHFRTSDGVVEPTVILESVLNLAG